MNRRNFLLGTGLALTSNISVYGLEEKKDTSVLFIWLGGGISQIEFINPLPNAPLGVKSVTGYLNNEVCQIGGTFTNLNRIAKDITFVRSLHHRDSNHESATNWMITSEANFRSDANNWPSYGSLLVNQAGFVNKDMPTYVQTSRIDGDGPAWLGTDCTGYTTDLEGISNLTPKSDGDTFKRRLDIVSRIDKTKDHLPTDWIDLRAQSVKMIYGNTHKALDLKLEDQNKLAEYNVSKSKFGKDCLLAKRLIQNGSRFVNVNFGGWDNHSDILLSFESRGVELDSVLATVISDFKQTMPNTLIVVASEFSRTFKLNQSNGRDHWSAVNSLLLAGGNYTHGKLIGKTDSKGAEVTDQELSPKDLSWTIFNHLGVDKSLILTDKQQRPHRMFDSQAKNILEL